MLSLIENQVMKKNCIALQVNCSDYLSPLPPLPLLFELCDDLVHGH